MPHFVSQSQSKHLEQKQSRDIIIFSVAAFQLKFQVFEILGISLEIPSISNSRCEKPSISKFLIRNTQYFDRNPRFLIEILGISIEIPGFSFEILGISKISDNRIPYSSRQAEILENNLLIKSSFSVTQTGSLVINRFQAINNRLKRNLACQIQVSELTCVLFVEKYS